MNRVFQRMGVELTARRGRACVALCLVMMVLTSYPEHLSRSVREGPMVELEALIARGQYRDALAQIGALDVRALDVWEMQKVLLQQAICQKELGDDAAALSSLRLLESKDSTLADYIAFWKGQSAEALGQIDSAVVYYARVIAVSPMSLLRDEAAFRAAALSRAQGHFPEAEKHYRALLDKSTREADAIAGLIEVLIVQGDSAQARGYQLHMVRHYPDHAETRRVLKALPDALRSEELFYAGVAHRQNGNHRQAIALLRWVVQEAPEHLWQGRAQFEMGRAYSDSRQYRTAERAFERAFQVYQVPRALYELGHCAVRLGRNLDGAKLFLEFARRYPNVSGAADAMWQAAMAYERQGQHLTARRVFLDLAKTYPKSQHADQAAWRAGFALYQVKQYEAALQAFLNLARQTPENYLRDQGYFWVGKCYQNLGEEHAARTYFERAAQGFPASYYSARARSVLGITGGVYPAVHQGAPLALERSYRPSVHLQRGDVLASIGLYRQAEREFDRALQVHGGNLSALDDLLQRYERIRAMHKALQVSNQIVSVERQQGVPMTLASFRRLYPTYYWDEISKTAQELDVDPNLMIAIMRQESAFNHEAQSRVGARGLMQVMPATGREMAKKVQLKPFSTEDLYDPRISIRLGGQHLADHLRFFREDDDRRLGLALSAYNAGLNAARRWSQRLSVQDVDVFVETIPYRETRTYVKLVYRNYQVYSYLQGDAGGLAQGQVH